MILRLLLKDNLLPIPNLLLHQYHLGARTAAARLPCLIPSISTLGSDTTSFTHA